MEVGSFNHLGFLVRGILVAPPSRIGALGPCSNQYDSCGVLVFVGWHWETILCGEEYEYMGHLQEWQI